MDRFEREKQDALFTQEVLQDGSSKAVVKLQYMLESGYGMKMSFQEAQTWLEQAW